MMKQYRQIKSEIPEDAILLFRLGDFYEMFFEDAKIASPILDVTFTHRAGVPMCGVPYHALDNYLPRLLEAGKKVAIAEQVEDPRLAKGIVKREISRIITPGTVVDSSVLSPQQNNFLVALSCGKDSFGLACLDISTADFRVTETSTAQELETELHRLKAKECLVPESVLKKWEAEAAYPYPSGKILWTPVEDWIFSYDTASEALLRHFKVASLDGFGCRDMKRGVSAAGAVLHYASENLRRATGHLRKIVTYRSDDYMVLDQISQRNLELVEPISGKDRSNTLIGILDETVTPMGSRLLREWILRPLRKIESISKRLDAIESMTGDPILLAEIREIICMVRDMERIIARLNIGSANARDLRALALSFEAIPSVKSLLDNLDSPLINEIKENLHPLPELVSRINEAIVDEPPILLTDGGVIKEGFNKELDELRSAATEGKNWLAEIQAKEQERSGIKSLKIRFNKVFGYYIEISKSNLGNIPDDYIRKQTLVNAERFITPELKEIESKILGSEDKSKALEYEIFQELKNFSLEFTSRIQETASALGVVDVTISLAECARKYNYCRPHINEDDTINITAGRHPVLDAKMLGQRFVPNDTLLDGTENQMMIITGPNMAGKSTYIRQTALLVLMAHMGSFIPAQSAIIGITDRIFTRVGAADDLSRGQSTFMVEMTETANILNHATDKSLVILDEIGRGTSTFDGLSIAWAVAEYIHDTPGSRARTLFATHYHELTELSMTRKGVKNYNVAVKEYGDQIIFLRQIVPGGTDKSYGIHVAKLAGLPDEVVKRAREVLENLEASSIGESNEPVLAKHKTRHPTTKEKIKGKSQPLSVKESVPSYQPSLFDTQSR
ncbi:MAG: DNA mismatch repair protein MutS [Lentisphaerae bacterium GWF2_45_14]|nr:MAG: DNA mismatch repair protein MutS [Lentisphaerae bacterium GWF2_45_14]